MSDKQHNPTLARAKDNEPLFVLRAQDNSSPRIVMLWLADNINYISDAKARAAFEDAMEMRKWVNRKAAD